MSKYHTTFLLLLWAILLDSLYIYYGIIHLFHKSLFISSYHLTYFKCQDNGTEETKGKLPIFEHNTIECKNSYAVSLRNFFLYSWKNHYPELLLLFYDHIVKSLIRKKSKHIFCIWILLECKQATHWYINKILEKNRNEVIYQHSKKQHIHLND